MRVKIYLLRTAKNFRISLPSQANSAIVNLFSRRHKKVPSPSLSRIMWAKGNVVHILLLLVPGRVSSRERGTSFRPKYFRVRLRCNQRKGLPSERANIKLIEHLSTDLASSRARGFRFEFVVLRSGDGLHFRLVARPEHTPRIARPLALSSDEPTKCVESSLGACQFRRHTIKSIR